MDRKMMMDWLQGQAQKQELNTTQMQQKRLGVGLGGIGAAMGARVGAGIGAGIKAAMKGVSKIAPFIHTGPALYNQHETTHSTQNSGGIYEALISDTGGMSPPRLPSGRTPWKPGKKPVSPTPLNPARPNPEYKKKDPRYKEEDNKWPRIEYR